MSRICSEPQLSVIVPTLNEKGNIKPLSNRLRRSLESRGIDCFEVIFVDDGSTDGTLDEIIAVSKLDRRFKVIVRRGERGLSSAIVTGLSKARARYAVVMDADLQHPPEVVPDLLDTIKEGYDIVVASRYKRGGGVEGWNRFRLTISLGATILAWLLVPESRRTSDPMSGFFAIDRSRVTVKLSRGSGFKLLLDILASNPQARVADVPYIFSRRLRGESKLTGKVILLYIMQLLILSRPLRFAAVGLGGTIVNLTVLYTLLRLNLPLDLAILSGFEAGLLFNFIFHEVVTFRTGFRGALLRRLVAFHGASILAILVGYTVSRSLITLAGLNEILSQLAGIAAGYTINYLASSRGVWGRNLRENSLG